MVSGQMFSTPDVDMAAYLYYSGYQPVGVMEKPGERRKWIQFACEPAGEGERRSTLEELAREFQFGRDRLEVKLGPYLARRNELWRMVRG